MRNDNVQSQNNDSRNGDASAANNEAKARMDLTDNAHDRERLQPEETTIDLPDVKDIPGQEFVHPLPLGELADTTISSADEEGEGLFGDDEDEDTDVVMGTEADITAIDRETLARGENYMPTRDEALLQQASLDNTDFEGEPLNERSFGEELSGADIDSGDMEDGTRTDALGQGDEENQNFSLGSDENDASENRSDGL